MLKTSFSSIQEMLEYNQALLSTLEMLYEYEADKWNSREEPHDTLCDHPQYRDVYFNVEFDSFVIPCWLSCDVTYTGGFADSDPYVPYTVEIPLKHVVEYMKENYGYE